MQLIQAVVSRGHVLFGMFFLLIVADEIRRRLRRSWSGVAGLLVPAAFLVSGAAMWLAVIRANTPTEYVVHSLWADILLGIGAIEWARRSGRLPGSRWSLIQPVGIFAAGVLLFVHLHGSLSASPGAQWHAAMGGALVAAGLIELVVQRLGPARRGWAVAAQAPLLGFVALLLTYPN